MKDIVELKRKEAPSLQEQQDQCLSYHQQYMTGYQQKTCEKEAANHQQLLMQTQLLNHLQHEKMQGNMAVEKVYQEHLGGTSQQNQKLQAQLSLLALSGEEDGIDKEEKNKEAPGPNLIILEDLDN
jgi:hypothetical protein